MLAFFTLLQILHDDTIDKIRDSLRGYNTYGKSIGSTILLPLTSQHYPKVGYSSSTFIAADTVKAQIRQMMLTTGIKSAADLNVQIL